MPDLRILRIITGLAYGGAETQLVQVAIRLKARGWEVRIVSLMPPKAYMEELESAGIPVFSLGIQRKIPNPLPLFRLARIIRSWRPQIVHSHMVHANLIARLVQLIAPIPVLICTAHNINERGRKGSGRLREILYRLTDPLCDLTTQICQVGLERYVQVGAVPRNKIRYIPNGVDTERFKPNPEVREHIRQGMGLSKTFVWLAVGRFDPQKDYPTMLKAIARVVKERLETVLLIAGDGPLRPAMEDLAQQLGIAERTRFLGIRRDIPDLMNTADGFVMSSAWEGMPMVLLEASTSGLPVVATDVGGNREVVLNGVSGFLVPPGNPQALAKALITVMDLPPEERIAMGEAGHRHVEANYSMDRVVEMWEALYWELFRRKGTRV